MLLTSVGCAVAVQPLSRWNVRTSQCPPAAVSGPLYTELLTQTVYPTLTYTHNTRHSIPHSIYTITITVTVLI